jgi:hypothetical protein
MASVVTSAASAARIYGRGLLASPFIHPVRNGSSACLNIGDAAAKLLARTRDLSTAHHGGKDGRVEQQADWSSVSYKGG